MKKKDCNIKKFWPNTQKIGSSKSSFFFFCKSDICFAYTGQMSGSKALRKVYSWSDNFHLEISGLEKTEVQRPHIHFEPLQCVHFTVGKTQQSMTAVKFSE